VVLPFGIAVWEVWAEKAGRYFAIFRALGFGSGRPIWYAPGGRVILPSFRQETVGSMQDQAAGIRCWVFGSSRPLQEGNAVLAERLTRFFSQWNSHGAAVAGKWRILENRFLVVLREPEGAEVSGCSIDSMVKLLEKELDTRLLDSSRIFYRSREGSVEAVNRLEFKALAAEGAISPDTEVFDTTLTALADLTPGIFSKPLKDSWHAVLYGQAVKQPH
jgi:hypothetical protein